MSESGRDARQDVRDWSVGLPDVWECSRGPPDCQVVVGRPSRMSGSSRDALQDVREWSGGPPGCPGVVGMPSRMSGSGRETLPDVREW